MPFNRAERSYVYRAAKNVDTTHRLWVDARSAARRRDSCSSNSGLSAILDQDAAPIAVLEIIGGPYALGTPIAPPLDLQHFRHELWRDLSVRRSLRSVARRPDGRVSG